MSLAAEATQPLPNVGVQLTCHVATWFWAAQAAQALALTPIKAGLVTLGNIATMASPAQPAILDLLRYGIWDFATMHTTPPVGTVLLWTTGATHSAVVTAPGQITGYNQIAQFNIPGNNVGHTVVTPAQLLPNQMQCAFISERLIVAKAGELNL